MLADPAGYEFCVIEPGNGYLAGCGPLGELTCAGTRQVTARRHESRVGHLGWHARGAEPAAFRAAPDGLRPAGGGRRADLGPRTIGR
ncbi:hypothetical protein Amsp01_057070 [Amycolatopsis sp. NBRC 101858]|nr:hypothetical protein Amsp01_057070 [Amycolatopsis sp. NBRC 101858]